MGKSSLALAEEALLQKRIGDALRHAKKAKKLIDKGSPDWLTASDIIAAANAGKKKR
jgi:predicted Zn-dependent protease